MEQKTEEKPIFVPNYWVDSPPPSIDQVIHKLTKSESHSILITCYNAQQIGILRPMIESESIATCLANMFTKANTFLSYLI